MKCQLRPLLELELGSLRGPHPQLVSLNISKHKDRVTQSHYKKKEPSIWCPGAFNCWFEKAALPSTAAQKHVTGDRYDAKEKGNATDSHKLA